MALLLLRDGLAPLAAGVGVGLIAALVVARSMNALLYGVGALDVVAFGRRSRRC